MSSIASPPPLAHAPDDAGQHGEALLAVVAVPRSAVSGVDHGEGVEAGGVLAEGDEGAAEGFRRVLEGAPVVDHHRLAAGADRCPATSSCISTDLPDPDLPVTATL